MKHHAPYQPHSTPVQDPDDAEPAMPPLEPYEGLVAPVIPGDPEHERVVEPED